MTNFEFWINEVADIPKQADDGQWYDAETGFPFDPSYGYQSGQARQRFAPSEKAKKGRELAKAFGGRALKGTAKQKEWAEKIRAEKLQQMDMDQAELACDPSGLLVNSKFWIENRGKKGRDIGEFVQQQKALLKQYRTARAAGDADQVKELAEQYNLLTARWGF